MSAPPRPLYLAARQQTVMSSSANGRHFMAMQMRGSDTHSKAAAVYQLISSEILWIYLSPACNFYDLRKQRNTNKIFAILIFHNSFNCPLTGIHKIIIIYRTCIWKDTSKNMVWCIIDSKTFYQSVSLLSRLPVLFSRIIFCFSYITNL